MVNPAYTAEMLEILRLQETELVFEKFDAADAWEIARLLCQAMSGEPKSVAMQAVLDGFTVLRYYPPATGPINEFWMGKKYNTVSRTGTSSLRAAAELALSDREPVPWELDEEHFALCGGGFPIYVRGKGMVGVYCVSGLPHLEDHRLLTAAISQYLRIPQRHLPTLSE